MNNRKAIILCGLPACGKTTYRKQLVSDLDPGSVFVYSSDDFLETIKEFRSKDDSYSSVFNDHIKTATIAANQGLDVALEEDTPIIIWDQTNLSLKKRDRIRQKLTNNYQVEIHCFPPPRMFSEESETQWKERLKKREEKEGKNIPSDVLDVMMKTYEVPSYNTSESVEVFIEARNTEAGLLTFIYKACK